MQYEPKGKCHDNAVAESFLASWLIMKTTSHAQRLRKASLNILKYFIIDNEDIPIWAT
jgi:hypothetical protein